MTEFCRKLFDLGYGKIKLHDDDTENGGVSHYGETLKEFIFSIDGDERFESLEEINDSLVHWGIKPVKITI